MKRFSPLLTLLLTLALFPLPAQEVTTPQEYLRRYNSLVQRVGADGVGVETLLNKWEATYPEDVQQKLARFQFCFERSRTPRVIQLDRDRYLGREPILPMTDSLGRKCNYFQDVLFDDDLFAAALQALDKAIASRPDRLDYRMLRADALLAYGKEEPDMALQELKALADRHYRQKPAWEYEGLDSVDDARFLAFLQDYCAAIFRIGSDASAEAFRSLSEHLLAYDKDNPLFLDNLGSYYLVKKNYKTARKYFDQVLKKHPGDMTALRNGLLLARSVKDRKLETRYLALMAEHGETETDRESARIRLQAYRQK